MENYIVSVIAFLAFLYVAKILNEKATKKLSTEQKAELVDLFSTRSPLRYGIIILLIILYFLLLKYHIFEPMITMAGYFVVLLLFIIYTARISYFKLKTNNFPDSFIKVYIGSTVLRLLGIVLMMAFLVGKPF
jgi:cobalamin synthase